MQAESGISAVRMGTCCSAHAHSTKPPPPKVRVVQTQEEEEEGENHEGDMTIDDNGGVEARTAADVVEQDHHEEAKESGSAPAETEEEEEEERETGLPLADVIGSPVPDLFIRLVEDKYGAENVQKNANFLRINASQNRIVDVRFSDKGHVGKIESKSEDALPAEKDVRQLALLANQTLHPIC
jgi:hypothetical protein